MIWDKISTYNEIIQKYINCGQSRYGKYVVLFDRRRLMKVAISPDKSADLESESFYLIPEISNPLLTS